MATDDTLLRTLLIVVTAIFLAPFLVMAVMIPAMGLWGAGHMWGGGMWNGAGATEAWLLMWLVALTIVLGLGYLLFRVVRSPDDRETDPALEELRMAYARGDLSDEEFEERRDRLRKER